MKTVQSFFPTRAKSKQSHFSHEKIFHLIRKNQSDQNQHPLRAGMTQNIFRDQDNHLKKYSLDEQVERPVGGVQLFKKMQKAAKQSHHGNERKTSKRSNKQFTQRNIQTAGAGSRFRKQRQQSEQRQPNEVIRKMEAQRRNLSNIECKQQLFKSQHMYTPHANANALDNGRSSLSEFNKRAYKSEIMMRPSSTTNKIKVNGSTSNGGNTSHSNTQHHRWVDEQQKCYQDKMAFLNEINYKKPLVQLYGDRYFQFLLRDRFLEDFKPPSYIYQIRDKFSENKVISRLRKYKPNILERRKLVVKGHNKYQEESNQQKKQRQ